MAETPPLKRVAYSPGEFAELFGKSQTWGYRQIYSGKVTAITEHGRILIPAKEVERVLESAGIYNGKEKPKQAKARLEKLTPEQQSVWQRFVRLRGQSLGDSKRTAPGKAAGTHGVPGWKQTSRVSALRKIAASWSGNSAHH